MTIKQSAVILIALLIVSYTPVYTVSSSVNVQSNSYHVTGVAVRKGEGYPVFVSVDVSPNGNGSVIIYGVKGDSLLYNSIEEACYVVAWMLGKNPYLFNYYVYINPAMPNVTYMVGPSLSLAVSLAALTSFLNVKPSPDVMVTGMVNPDGTVGFVGLVREKAEAAEKYGYSLFVYPLEEDKTFKVVNVPVHLGPYAFLTRMLQVEGNVFYNITVDRLGVVSIWDAAWASIEINSSPAALTLPSNSYSIDSLYAYSVGPGIDAIKRAADLLSKASIYLSQAEAKLSEARKYMTLEAYVETLKDVNRAKQVIESIIARGNISSWADIYDILRVYQESARIFYLTNLIVDLRGVPSYVLSSLNAAGEILTNVINNNLTVEEIPLVALAATKYYEAERLSNVTLSLLALVIYGYVSLSKIVGSLSSNLARVDRLAQEAIILALSGRQYASRPAPPLRSLAERYVSYAWHLYRYAMDLSMVSRVYSNLTGLAGGYAWKAMYILNNSRGPVDVAAALGFAVDGVALASTYMALHPGYPPLIDERFKAAITFAYALGQVVGPNPFYSYELSRIYGNSSIDIYYIERIIAYEKLITIAIGTSTYHTLNETAPREPSSNAVRQGREQYSVPLNTTTQSNESSTAKPREKPTITQIITANIDIIISLAVLVMALSLTIASTLRRRP